MQLLSNFLSTFTIDHWFVLGMVGQVMFFSRMIVQWLYSEKYKKSMIPPLYWYLSLIGSVIIIIYAYGRGDLVIFVGQLVAILIYFRNVMFVRREE